MKKEKRLQGKEEELVKMQGSKMNSMSRRILEKRQKQSTEQETDFAPKIING